MGCAAAFVLSGRPLSAYFEQVSEVRQRIVTVSSDDSKLMP